MKINNKKSHKKSIIITSIILVVLVLAATGVYVYAIKPDSINNKTQQTSPMRSESDKEQAEALEKNPDNKSTPVNTDTPAEPTTGANGKKTAQMVASTDSTSDAVFIRGGLNTIVYEGTCFALLSGPNGESIQKNTTLMQNPSSTDCKTISVSKSELSKGKWTVTLNLTSSSLEGKSNESSFDI